jgi:hypothetical protein
MKLTLGYFQRMAFTVMLLSLPHFGSAQLVGDTCMDGTVSPIQSVCPGTQPTDLVLTDNTGAVIKWQSSPTPDFSAPTDIGVTASVLSGNAIGAIIVTTYFRAVVQSGTCSFSASGYAMVSVKAVAPNPGSLSRFTLFTAIGAVSNIGITTIQGDVGTNSGDITGFEAPSAIDGTIQSANAATAQATTDVNALFTTLYSTPATNSHIPIFGNGETLFGGVYAIQEAASVAGNLTLDAQGDPDRVFIFRALGAFTTVAGTTVTLTNGAIAANIFWVADGAIIIAASTNMKGILVANGAISMGTAGVLDGQMYSTGGVITTSANSITQASPTGGVLSGGATICPSAENVLTLSGYNGSIKKWQSSTVSDFSSNISDIANTTATLTAPPITESTWFRAVIESSGCTGERYSETAALIMASTVWNGASWSNGMPGPTTALIFNASFVATQDIEACTVVVNTGANVVVPTGYNMTVNGKVAVNGGTLTIENNANLVQIQDVNNTGTISVIKNSAPIYRLDYTMWSSPVAGETLIGFSPATLPNRFYHYNPLSDNYALLLGSSIFEEGLSYLIRVNNTHPAFLNAGIPGTPWTGTFEGTPHNGDVNITVVPFSNHAGGENGVNGYNAIGNPYPSSINIADFYAANINNMGSNTSLYFWRKKNNAQASSYASLTLAGYIENAALGGDSSNGVFNDPDNSDQWVINTGQGFIVQAETNTISFNNGMRRGVNNGQLFRTARDSQKSRLWLNLTGLQGEFSQMAVAYTNTSTLGLDYGWDGKALLDGNVAIYSLAQEFKLGIQARPTFDASDVVPVAYKINDAGMYTISLDHFDGVFAVNQDIYLRDNLLGGVMHSLKQSPYEFASEAGVFSGRFDLLYTAETLAKDNPAFDSSSVIVYKMESGIYISTGSVVISAVSAYDMRGRLLYKANTINAMEIVITGLQSQEQLLIVRITDSDNKTVTKKVIF